MSHLAAHPSTENFSRAFSRRLSELERIEPVPLADLFSLVNGDEPVLGELRNVLHASLLDRTIAHARQHTIFYASDPAYAEWTPRTDGRPSPLDGLPIVDRPLMASRLRDFLADDVHLRSICHTSGTTGLPLDVYKSFEEIAFINAFYTRLFEPFARLLTSRPLVLSFPNVHHGVPVPMPGIGLTFVGGVTEDGLIEDAIRILDTRYDIEGHDHKISIVSGLDHHLMLFTAALLDRGIEPRRFELNAINITGGFISTHWLRFLEDTWNCVVNDRFTLTEVIGGASRLRGSDVFVLDPHLVGEVLDYDSRRPVDGGVGLLALTNLHPFVQLQPTIRYLTGDLVRRIPCDGPLRFQFLGKSKNCISRLRNGTREWLLFSAHLNDLLHQFGDIRTFDRYSNLVSICDRSLGSHPVVQVTSQEIGNTMLVRIAIELRYSPHGRPLRVAEMKSQILRALENTPDTVFAGGRKPEDVDLDVVFCGPGATNAPIVVKI